MSTIAGNLYRIGYQIITNGTNPSPDPPQSVGPLTFVTVNAASAAAAVTALTADLSLSGSQRLSIQSITQDNLYAGTIYS